MPTLTASYLPVSAQRIAWMETMLREDESSTDELLERHAGELAPIENLPTATECN
jgi:hypothetical protein